MTYIPTLDEALDYWLFGGMVLNDTGIGPLATKWGGLLTGRKEFVDEFWLGATRESIRARIFRSCLARGVSVRVGYRQKGLLIQRVEPLCVIERRR